MITNKKTIHVFGVEGIDKCSHEEYNLLFDKNFNIDDFLYKKNNNLLKRQLSKILGLTLFIASNPQYTLAYSKLLMSTGKSIGDDLFSKAKTFTIYGVLIVTVFRLFSEYSRGGSKYRVSEILKECVLIILSIIFLPKVPIILENFIGKHFNF